jgi:phosphatidate cytidylyltransferase
MIVRIVAALVGLAVLVPAIVFGGRLAVHIIVPVAIVLCVFEYARMAFGERWSSAMLVLLPGVVLPYAAALYAPQHAWVVWGLVVVGASTRVVLRPGPSLDVAYSDLGRYAFGMAWIGLLVFLAMLRDLPDGLGWVFFALGGAWLSDTGAYFSGVLLGKTPLHPALSPKKTVEGFIGGLATTVLGLGVIAWWGVPSLGWLDVVVFGSLVGALGVVGDLAESLVKRAVNVKDAGTLMPGHGGLLDRIDSLLFVAPALYGYAVLVKGVGA